MENELKAFLDSCVMFGERPTGKYIHVGDHEVLIIIRHVGQGEDQLPVVEYEELPEHLSKIHADLLNYFDTGIVLNGSELIPESSPFQYMWVVEDYIVGLSVTPLNKE
ncbi:hypothetical protein [Vibrio phage VP4B]|uniref:Uncharacterized protein n=1 Tax=Vibrio phage VP4B TaxID=1262540 RepID=V9LZM4_9CAUD|nr:hypothetical protein FDJ61_gp190 [Vibrio phage VP4B]AGB07304.1 hypothetical protein [Vibrio phage VP4B]